MEFLFFDKTKSRWIYHNPADLRMAQAPRPRRTPPREEVLIRDERFFSHIFNQHLCCASALWEIAAPSASRDPAPSGVMQDRIRLEPSARTSVRFLNLVV